MRRPQWPQSTRDCNSADPSRGAAVRDPDPRNARGIARHGGLIA